MYSIHCCFICFCLSLLPYRLHTHSTVQLCLQMTITLLLSTYVQVKTRTNKYDDDDKITDKCTVQVQLSIRFFNDGCPSHHVLNYIASASRFVHILYTYCTHTVNILAVAYEDAKCARSLLNMNRRWFATAMFVIYLWTRSVQHTFRY